jgi:SAM-dependent methyltransferase
METTILRSTDLPETLDRDELREAISEEYAQVATSPEKGFHFHTGRKLARLLKYQEEWIEFVPETSVESFAGTGNPFAMGRLNSGEHVLDVGCGAGFDSLIASHMVGSKGHVMGIDMTTEMVAKAKLSAVAAGADNLDLSTGDAEHLPSADNSIDVIISNGVFNLIPGKATAAREWFRVLKPGGRLQIADIAVTKAVPFAAKDDIDLWTG